MLNDLRYAIRSLLKTPSFTAVALLTLALGIGLNTAVFSLLSTAVLRSLPVQDPQNLLVVNWVGRTDKMDASKFLIGGVSTPADFAGEKKWGAFTYDTYELFRDRAEGGTSVFGFQPFSGDLATKENASTAEGLFVSGNFFAGYGAQPLLGRSLTAEDDRKNAPAVAVISYRLWQREFGLNSKAVGQVVTVNGLPCTIVGILPRGFADPLAGNPSDVFIPFALRTQGRFDPMMTHPRLWGIQIMARLASGANPQRVTASLNVLFNQMLRSSEQKDAAGHLKVVLDEGRRGPLSASLIFEQIARPMWILMAAVGMLLLIACANLAGLLLARAGTRTRELAIRAAIGASRWKLVRLLFLENVLLAMLGGALGVMFAAWVLSSVSQSFFSRWLAGGAQLQASLDVQVLIFTFAVSLLTAAFFGALPVWRATRADPLKGLKNESPSGWTRLKLGGVLVAVQVSLSVVLLAGAGLLARTFANLDAFNPGFSTENRLLFDLKPGRSGYYGERETQFYESVSNSMAATPGVNSVTMFSQRLLTGQGNFWLITVPGRATTVDPAYLAQIPTHPERYPMASTLSVDDAYFSTMGIPLLRGRSFNAADTRGSLPVAVVNQTFVRRYLKNTDPIGATFAGYGNDEIYRIVGVTADAKFADIKNETIAMAYFTHRQSPIRGAAFAVRSSLPPASLAPAIRKIVAGIDPKIPVADLTSQKILIDKLNSQERILAAFGGFVAVLAALLAGIGLFSLLAYTVSRRTNEIGVHMALGARQKDVTKLVLGQGPGSVAMGIAAGIVGALWATQFLRSFLWGVEANDFLTIAGASILLCVVAAFACFIPARRAVNVDPLVALRVE